MLLLQQSPPFTFSSVRFVSLFSSVIKWTSRHRLVVKQRNEMHFKVGYYVLGTDIFPSKFADIYITGVFTHYPAVIVWKFILIFVIEQTLRIVLLNCRTIWLPHAWFQYYTFVVFQGWRSSYSFFLISSFVLKFAGMAW